MWFKECFDGYPWGSEVVLMGIGVAQRVYVTLGIRVAQRVFHWVLAWLKECFTGYSCVSECLAGYSCG